MTTHFDSLSWDDLSEAGRAAAVSPMKLAREISGVLEALRCMRDEHPRVAALRAGIDFSYERLREIWEPIQGELP